MPSVYWIYRENTLPAFGMAVKEQHQLMASPISQSMTIKQIIARFKTNSSRIWLDGWSDDWNPFLRSPIYYLLISLLNIVYEGQSSVLCERQNPTVNKVIGLYEWVFKPGKPRSRDWTVSLTNSAEVSFCGYKVSIVCIICKLRGKVSKSMKFTQFNDSKVKFPVKIDTLWEDFQLIITFVRR